MAENTTCPRCLGQIPNNEMPGAYMGALSRLTRTDDVESVYICSACGLDEAVGHGLIPQNMWPFVTDSTPPSLTRLAVNTVAISSRPRMGWPTRKGVVE